MLLRRYKKSDLYLLMELFYDTVHTVNLGDYTQEQVDIWAPKEPDVKKWLGAFDRNITYIAEIDKIIVGFGDLNAQGYIHALYTHKDWQKEGVGSAILEKLESEARALGLNKVMTESSITAKGFFEQKGYMSIQELIKHHEGIEFIYHIMKKGMDI